jgi:prepilin-type N-terminal cleavage/methylation domain-containing protein
MSKQELKQKGFTIIEVVLVLAIAALIFLMVFIALPALQASQRDTARKSDVSIVAAAVNSWAGNNRGKALSTMTSANLNTYATNKSDNTTTISVVPYSSAPTSVTDGNVVVVTGAKCGTVGANGVVGFTQGTVRQYAVITRLEGGTNSGYCLDS